MRPGGEIREGKIDLRPRLTGEEVRCHHASHSGNPWCGLASSFCLWPVACGSDREAGRACWCARAGVCV